MPTLELDEFVRRLQVSVAKAQANITAGNRGRLEHLVELGRDGQPEGLTWSFVIDAGAEAPGAQTVRLPLMTMRPYMAAQVEEVTLELKATIEQERPSRARENGGRLRLVIRRRAGWLRRRLHTLSITLRGAQPGSGEVSVDSVSLKTFGATPDRALAGASKRA